MDVLKKKGELPTIGSDNKFINIKSEGLDGVFAELFSLVNLSSIESTSTNNVNPNANEINNKIIDTGGEEIKSDKNSLLAAKSLISIFLNDKEITSNPGRDKKTSFNLKRKIRTFRQALDHQYNLVDLYNEGRPDKVPSI